MSALLAYMASPFSHPEESVRRLRYRAACKVAGRLMKEGWCIFAPIPHSFAIEEHFDDGKLEGNDFWLKQDFAVLRHCQRLFVLRLEGWDKSKGVAAEVALANTIGIPVEYIDP